MNRMMLEESPEITKFTNFQDFCAVSYLVCHKKGKIATDETTDIPLSACVIAEGYVIHSKVLPLFLHKQTWVRPMTSDAEFGTFLTF